jgi:hypothetical protein
MADDPNNRVRRVTQRDRKRAIEPSRSLFPPEEPASLPEDVVPPEQPPAPVARRTAAPKPAGQGCGGCLPNLGALLFLLLTFAAAAWTVLVYLNPMSDLNPLPPLPPPPIVITATFLPPTSTPLPTAGPTSTFTPIALPTTALPPSP